MYNTSDSPRSPSPTPRYLWPKPGEDLPRLPFEAWLRIYALEVGGAFSGDLGFMLGQHILALAEYAARLGAHSPFEYMRLSQAAADREAAYWALAEQALEECQVIHVRDEAPDGARLAWIPTNPNDETYQN